MNKKYLLRGYLGRYHDYYNDIETVDKLSQAQFMAKYHLKFFDKVVIFELPSMKKIEEVKIDG